MRDVLHEYDRLAARGEPVGRAVVTSVWGSAPRPEGASMLATPSGLMAGSVSGGCVESATVQAIIEAIGAGRSRLVTFGVTDEQAWTVGLACGGTIKVFVEPRVTPTLLEAARSQEGRVVATVVNGAAAGGSVEIREAGAVGGITEPPDGRAGAAAALAELARRLGEAAQEALAKEASRTVEVIAGDGERLAVFLEVFPRRPKLVIFGGVHVALALVPLAKALGYWTIVADGRQAFASRERFPDADEIIVDWPEGVFARVPVDPATYVCVLSHDPKFDEPALRLALRSAARYIGAIGSKKTQAERRNRLRAQGFTDEELTRVHGPIGLDLGGRQPAETALAILAEITQVRYGRAPSTPAGRG